MRRSRPEGPVWKGGVKEGCLWRDAERRVARPGCGCGVGLEMGVSALAGRLRAWGRNLGRGQARAAQVFEKLGGQRVPTRGGLPAAARGLFLALCASANVHAARGRLSSDAFQPHQGADILRKARGARGRAGGDDQRPLCGPGKCGRRKRLSCGVGWRRPWLRRRNTAKLGGNRGGARTSHRKGPCARQ